MEIEFLILKAFIPRCHKAFDNGGISRRKFNSACRLDCNADHKNTYCGKETAKDIKTHYLPSAALLLTVGRKVQMIYSGGKTRPWIMQRSPCAFTENGREN